MDKSSVSSDDIEEILSELSESVEERKAYQREWVLDNGEKLDYDLLNLENINDLKIYWYYAPVPFIEYESGNITYVDTNGRVFSGIWTITITSGSDSITILDRNLWATEVFNNISDNLTNKQELIDLFNDYYSYKSGIPSEMEKASEEAKLVYHIGK